jgi:hypothetical protein
VSRADVLLVVFRWLHEESVRILLWSAWRFVMERTGAAQDRAFERFTRLVDAVPCMPCRIEYMHPRAMEARAAAGLRCQPCLVILSAAAAEDEGFDREDLS